MFHIVKQNTVFVFINVMFVIYSEVVCVCVCVELEAAFLNEFQKYTCSLEKEKKRFHASCK